MGRDYIARGCTKQGGQVLLYRFPFYQPGHVVEQCSEKVFTIQRPSLPAARLPKPVTVRANTMLPLCALRRDDVLSGYWSSKKNPDVACVGMLIRSPLAGKESV